MYIHLKNVLKPQRSGYVNRTGHAHSRSPVPLSLHCYTQLLYVILLSPAQVTAVAMRTSSDQAHMLTFPTVRRCAALLAVQGPVSPERTSGQCQLPLPVASYSTAFKTIFHGIIFLIDFILWHTTLVAFNTFVHTSLILYEFGPPLWTMNRETWRTLRKASSLSGAVHAVSNHHSYLACHDATFLV